MKFYFWIMKLRRIDFSGFQFKYDRIHYNFEQFEIMGNISTYLQYELKVYGVEIGSLKMK